MQREMKLMADKAAGDSITLSSESVEIIKQQRYKQGKGGRTVGFINQQKKLHW